MKKFLLSLLACVFLLGAETNAATQNVNDLEQSKPRKTKSKPKSKKFKSKKAVKPKMSGTHKDPAYK